MVIKSLYGSYFQKSKSFLYPILGIKLTASIKPVQTYISWPGIINSDERKLIVVYKQYSTEGFRSFEKSVLFKNSMFDSFIELEDDHVAYIFTFEDFASDWDHFLQGRYSKFTSLAKTRLKNYFGEGTSNWGYVESYLYPEKFIDQYTELLADKNDQAEMYQILQKVGELCDPYNAVEETLVMERKEIVKLENFN